MRQSSILRLEAGSSLEEGFFEHLYKSSRLSRSFGCYPLQLFVHGHSPMWAKSLHCPDGQTASYQRDDSESREEPTIANSNNQGFRYDRANTTEDVSAEVVQSDA